MRVPTRSSLFWWITVPAVMVAGVLLVQVFRAAWIVTRAPIPPSMVAEPEHRLSFADMGFMVLAGDDLASLLGTSLAFGLGLGVVWLLSQWAVRQVARRIR
ncbi:hypothetical protein [Brevundimonas sp. FT23028]|uniref:hypothetical protein n=1 Tax=Brevundimonas sp. FT23028 TaxID=3393748 RepID=UPI003B589D2A